MSKMGPFRDKRDIEWLQTNVGVLLKDSKLNVFSLCNGGHNAGVFWDSVSGSGRDLAPIKIISTQTVFPRVWGM